MEEAFKQYVANLAVVIEGVAIAVIAFGVFVSLIRLIGVTATERVHPVSAKKDVWRRLGIWLLLGLEFELAADIIRTAISPSWTDLGQLAVIAVIRTFLNYFLERDLDQYSKDRSLASA